MNMYLLPHEERTGKQPVWSTYSLESLLTFYVAHLILLYLTLAGSCGGGRLMLASIFW